MTVEIVETRARRVSIEETKSREPLCQKNAVEARGVAEFPRLPRGFIVAFAYRYSVLSAEAPTAIPPSLSLLAQPTSTIPSSSASHRVVQSIFAFRSIDCFFSNFSTGSSHLRSDVIAFLTDDEFLLS